MTDKELLDEYGFGLAEGEDTVDESDDVEALDAVRLEVLPNGQGLTMAQIEALADMR